MTIALPARAKLNLDLRVTGKRPDGFHDIVSTMQAIELHDLLEVEGATETTLTVDGLVIGGDLARNTVLKAHRALEVAAGRPLPARIHLHKRIPPGSGLGGASSDAAAALQALARLHRLGEETSPVHPGATAARADLAALAAEVGADVPFFLRGGRARVEGVGERLTALPDEPAWFAIAWPGIELSTADVYRAWDEVGGEGPNELRRAAETVEPRLREFAASLVPTGGAWKMTGSGSAWFARCAVEAEANELVARLDCWTAVTRSMPAWA